MNGNSTMGTNTPKPTRGKWATVLFISLGCAKNQVDSEIMLHRLREEGFHLTDRPEEAETVVVNTCSFIESAVQESIETILEAARLKEEGRCRALVVTGCFPQRYGRALIRRLPEVDLFLGTEAFGGLVEYLKALLSGGKTPKMVLKPEVGLWDQVQRRFLFSTPGTAYLKIAEGCSNHCSYCTIPAIRGRLRSRPLEVLLAESRMLAEEGVKELILLAQDTTAYGMDLGGKPSLMDLLPRVSAVAGLEWIRLLYLRPERISEDLLKMMAEDERICPYFDLPLQHVNRRILQAMHRFYDRAWVSKLIDTIRMTVPQAVLRTTMIIGFPGEGEGEFKELLDFISEKEFDHLGAFLYSPEEGTPAAALPNRVPEEIGRERLETLMERQREISARKNRERIGTVEPVLVSGTSPESEWLIQGRTRFQAPDVDGVVYITDGEPRIGEIVSVEITQAHDYDLVGKVVA
jgi:ribosomal protein S12 methylthiotransferase